MGAAIITQFWRCYLFTPQGIFWIDRGGVAYQSVAATGWHIIYHRLLPWTAGDLLGLPDYGVVGGATLIVLPWWFVLGAWGYLVTVVWRRTRRAKAGRAFPVEEEAKVQ